MRIFHSPRPLFPRPLQSWWLLLLCLPSPCTSSVLPCHSKAFVQFIVSVSLSHPPPQNSPLLRSHLHCFWAPILRHSPWTDLLQTILNSKNILSLSLRSSSLDLLSVGCSYSWVSQKMNPMFGVSSASSHPPPQVLQWAWDKLHTKQVLGTFNLQLPMCGNRFSQRLSGFEGVVFPRA